jgi:hypothetical protein
VSPAGPRSPKVKSSGEGSMVVVVGQRVVVGMVALLVRFAATATGER